MGGRLLVYLPEESHIGISQRIEDENERALLREKLQDLIPPEDAGGYIVRTMAETASEKELGADIEYLRKLWSGIQEKSRTIAAPALLYQDLSLSLRVLRDFVNDESGRIMVDSRETFLRMQEFANE